VTLITDAQAAVFAGSVDLVLLGADALTEVGAVNKVGSRLIALAAREAGAPVYACCDSGKISVGESVARLVGLSGGGGGGGGRGGAAGSVALTGEEEHAANEVVKGWPDNLRAPAAGQSSASSGGGGGVQVRNIYFETVPLALLTGGVVVEGGVLKGADEIRAAVQTRRDQYTAAFQLVTLDHPPPAD